MDEIVGVAKPGLVETTGGLLAPKKLAGLTLDQIDVHRVTQYAAEDADVTLRLADVLAPKLREAGVEEVMTQWYHNSDIEGIRRYAEDLLPRLG